MRFINRSVQVSCFKLHCYEFSLWLFKKNPWFLLNSCKNIECKVAQHTPACVYVRYVIAILFLILSIKEQKTTVKIFFFVKNKKGFTMDLTVVTLLWFGRLLTRAPYPFLLLFNRTLYFCVILTVIVRTYTARRRFIHLPCVKFNLCVTRSIYVFAAEQKGLCCRETVMYFRFCEMRLCRSNGRNSF